MEARAAQLGHPEEPAEVEAPAQPERHHLEGDGLEPLATATGSADAGSAPAAAGGEAVEGLSIPENYARYFGTTPTSASFADAHTKPQEQSNEGREEAAAPAAAAAAAAAAWSTRSAIAGSSSASSRAHFQRSMTAQQAISVRLEKDLAKARADLRSIHAGSRTKKGGGGALLGVGLLPEQEERAGVNSSEGALDEADGDYHQTPPDNQTREDEDSGGAGGASVEGEAGEAVKSSVAGGSYMARVVAALLGGEPTAETDIGRAPSQSLRWADFPPALQAVFGEGQATATRMLSPDGAPSEQFGEALTRQQARSWSRRAAATTEVSERRGNPVGVDETRVRFAGKDASGESDTAARPVASTADRLRVDRGGRKAGRWEQGSHSGAGGVETASGVAGGVESGSLAGAFRGYEAKSPLLQRWLVERAAPSLSQSDDADRDAQVCSPHADSARRGLG